MTRNPRRPTGAAALEEIVNRLKGLGAEVEKAMAAGGTSGEEFHVDTPLGRMSGRVGVRVGPLAGEKATPRAAPSRRAAKPAEPLTDIHDDGVCLVVTTETDDPAPEVRVEGETLRIASAKAPERTIALPVPVRPETLAVTVVNGVLEARMTRAEPLR